MSCCSFSAERARLARRVAPAFCPEDSAGGAAEIAVVEARELERLTDRNECDSASALIRGLAQYLAALQIDHLGRDVSLRAVYEEWPDIADLDGSGFPAACVQVNGEDATYGGSMQATIIELDGGPDDGIARTLVVTSKYTATVTVDVSATEREERIGVCRAFEEAFQPRDHTGGLVLRLPFSWNQHAKYTLVGGGPTGMPEFQKMSVWMARYRFTGTIGVARYHEYPRAKPVISRGTAV